MNIYGIGVDIVQNKRIRDIIFKSYLPNFIRKVLHTDEQSEYKTIKMLSRQTQFIASRWAVKEAAVKALGRRQLVFDQMKIVKNIYGKPHLVFEGETNLLIKSQLRIRQVFVSLAHQDQYTIAYALATVDP